MRVRLLSWLLLTLSLIPAGVVAEVYIFVGSADGPWRIANNWDPATGPPHAGDKAIIPNGKTCLVDSDEAGELVDVQTGGTLTIAGKTLALADDGAAGQTGGIVVNGTLRFERAGGVRGVLRYSGADSPPNFAITGGGTLIAEGSTHAGRIENAGITGTETLTIGDGDANTLTVKGTITILIEKLDVKSDALLRVESATCRCTGASCAC